MKTYVAFCGLFFLWVFQSCDIVDGPYSANTGGTTDTNNQVLRKILIEDFTGHQCGNCPRAAEALKAIEELYPGQVVPLGIHVGFFAEPSSSGNYTADYRTETGDELDQYYGNSVAGLPNGLINRISFDSNPIVQYTDWSSKAAQLVSLPPDATIDLNPQYNAATRSLQVNADVDILTALSDSLHLALYLSEDNIVSPQKDYSLTPSTIVNYTHRHVLRGSMNGTWGLPLSAGTSFAAGSTFSANADFTLPANWNDSNLHVVAILFRAISKEVIQVEDVKIIN
jgi:thiol-disulfide isomerase/thioredoxin